MDARMAAARTALTAARDELLARPNVVATGVGFKRVGEGITGELSVVCSVTRKLAEDELTPQAIVPREVAGVRTDVVQTGVIRALSLPGETTAPAEDDPLAAHRARRRPAVPGTSIGHVAVTAGTFGCLVRRGDELFILSNNHVLAASNTGSPGDAILQPGSFDGGTDPADRIATLETFIPIAMPEASSACPLARGAAGMLNGVARLLGSDARLKAVSTAAVENLVDCALARPLGAGLVSAEILGLGAPAGTAGATLGTKVRKSGRTTGLTSGEIEQVDVTVDVAFGDRTARFADQLMAGAMSAGGDSGSLAVDERGNAVGLLFAGSEATTLFNRIENVFAALEVGLP